MPTLPPYTIPEQDQDLMPSMTPRSAIEDMVRSAITVVDPFGTRFLEHIVLASRRKEAESAPRPVANGRTKRVKSPVSVAPEYQKTTARLVTLDIAIAPYHGVSLRTARNWIRNGLLPAAKLGRGYLVSPDDVARLLAPKLRAAPAKAERETPMARAVRQLRRAGIDA